MIHLNTLKDVDQLIEQMKAEQQKKDVIISEAAKACMGWPYVFGAWGEWCVPRTRGSRMRDDHPTIKSKCIVCKSGDWKNKTDNHYCTGCQWGCGVRMFDCRGFTYWLLKQVGITLSGQGATSQYNTSANWVQRGEIGNMPNVVCCVFQKSGNTMQHTGMHIGNGVVIHCSVNVQEGNTSDRAWTHYAIPAGLYSDVPQVDHPTLRKGSQGEWVTKLQELLTQHGYACGTIDGKFGSKTETAVKAFQKAKNLVVDGVCGKKTWAALEEQEVRYNITIPNVSFEFASKVIELCEEDEISLDVQPV